jgi:hypothetical protein
MMLGNNLAFPNFCAKDLTSETLNRPDFLESVKDACPKINCDKAYVELLMWCRLAGWPIQSEAGFRLTCANRDAAYSFTQ